MQSAEKVIVTTTTFYGDPYGKDQTRFNLVCELAELAKNAGHIVVIVDGSPSPVIKKKLENIGAYVVSQSEKDMGAARSQVWREAAKLVAPDVAAILWTEEKPDIVRFIEDMVVRMRNQNAQVVIPSRNSASWETYPFFQRESEQIANLVYNNLFPNAEAFFDPMFGPVCFSQNALPYFAEFNPVEWDLPNTYVQLFVPVFIRSRGFKVTSINVDFIYSPAQRTEEEKIRSAEINEKRFWQLKHLVSAFFTMHNRFSSIPR